MKREQDPPRADFQIGHEDCFGSEENGSFEELFAAESYAFKANQDSDKLNPAEYMTILINGLNQPAFGLPHFVTKIKDIKIHSLKVKLIDILDHGLQNKAAQYTMTVNF